MSLNEAESKQFAELLRKLSFPVSQEVFTAWCEHTTTIAVELAVVRMCTGEPELFLTYREDFKGYHIPGSILRPHEKMQTVLKRVCDDEIQMPLEDVRFLTWAERAHGGGPGDSPRGDEIAFLFCAVCESVGRESAQERFFPLHAPPVDLMPLHHPFFAAIQREYGIA